VTDLVAVTPPSGWGAGRVEHGRAVVAGLLQDHRDLDVVAVVRDPAHGIRIAGPADHETLLGRAGALPVTRRPVEGPIVVSPDGRWTTDGGVVRVELAPSEPSGSGLDAVVHRADSDAVRLAMTTESGQMLVDAIRGPGPGHADLDRRRPSPRA